MKEQLLARTTRRKATRAMDERRPSGAESAFKGKNTGRKDFQADEAND
jgi:hypothetical protein